MCLSRRPDDPFLGWRTPGDVDDQTRHEVAQVEAPVESVGEGAEVAGGVLAVLQRVESAGQGRLEVAQHRVDPLELRQVAGLAVTHDHRRVQAPGVGHCGEAGKAVAGNHAAGHQAGLGPLADRGERETTDQVELEVQRPALGGERDGGDERQLVLRASPSLAAGTLAAEVGVVDFDVALEPMAGLALGHDAVDLVVQQPRGGVAHAEVALERQRSQTSLGLADQVDGQEPGRKRQLGVLEQAACSQRGLVPARLALEELACAMANHVVGVAGALRAPKAARPASPLHRLGALRLGAKAVQEFGQRHAVLELDGVVGHGARSVMKWPQPTRRVAHGVSLLRLVSNQESV